MYRAWLLACCFREPFPALIMQVVLQMKPLQVPAAIAPFLLAQGLSGSGVPFLQGLKLVLQAWQMP